MGAVADGEGVHLTEEAINAKVVPPKVQRPTGYNIRDIAEVDPQRLRQGLVFRSSEIFSPAALHDLRIQSAVDLRKAGRRDSRAAKRGDDPRVLPADRSTDASGKETSRFRLKSVRDRKVAAGEHTLSELGITVFHIELLPPRAKLRILWLAPRPLKWRVLRSLLTCGSPREVLAPAVADSSQIGYGKLYCLILDCSKPLICRALKVFSHSDNLPAVVHCTHGKDRTGLLVALLLLLVGVPEDAVVRDYILSEQELRGKREEVVEDGHISSGMVNSKMIASTEAIMRQALTHLDTHHGGIHAYAQKIGLSKQKIQDIRRCLLREEVFQDDTAGA
mmetsp:Transcript_6664/g.19189  ORF Transcript_6664/g.19189 Transcript_6664/m.19189 type:complete len:334 (+) Transcript_6664:230-1231(+)